MSKVDASQGQVFQIGGIPATRESMSLFPSRGAVIPRSRNASNILELAGNIVDMYVRPAPVCRVLESRQHSKDACAQ
jgi:hypothetical protein